MTHVFRRRLASTAIVAGLLWAGGTPLALAGPAFAAQPASAHAATTESPLDAATRAVEVAYAQQHWNWKAWNDSTSVPFGSGQPDYQCAEFVARSLAAAGLVPGLAADAPQNDYFTYTAPNGKVYDLLLISDLPQYHNLYDYLMDSGIGQDIGDHPEQALPGDIVVTYAGPGGTKSHTGLVDQAATAGTEPTVDAHNNARLQFGYHYYAPSHLVRLVPNTLLEVWAWAAEQQGAHSGPQPAPSTPQKLLRNPAPLDPAGPQV